MTNIANSGNEIALKLSARIISPSAMAQKARVSPQDGHGKPRMPCSGHMTGPCITNGAYRNDAAIMNMDTAAAIARCQKNFASGSRVFAVGAGSFFLIFFIGFELLLFQICSLLVLVSWHLGGAKSIYPYCSLFP